MAKAPAAQQHQLLAVQALDTRLRQLEHQHRTLPVLKEIAALGNELADLDGALAISRTEAADLRRELKKAEADVEQVTTRALRNRQRLDTESLGAKEAQSLVAEAASLQRRQGTLEEIQLDVMERLDAHEDTLAKVEAARDQVVAAREAAIVQRDEEAAVIVAEHRDVKAKRAAAAATIEPSLLALYVSIRDKHDGLGAGRLIGTSCGACRMTFNPVFMDKIRAAADDDLITCEECGRLLIRDAAAPAVD